MHIYELIATKEESIVDRTMSVDDKIRRAEEIYNRRMNSCGRVHSTTVSVSTKKDNRLFKKMIIQICICFFIYLIYYLCKNSTYIFSEQFLEKTKEILSYNIDMEKTYENIKGYFESTENSESNEIIQNFENSSNAENSQQDNKNEAALPEAVSAEPETLSVTEEMVLEEVSSISQMGLDEAEIKSKVSMQVPVAGTVTSRFGTRNPSEIISAYHQGVDIAANTGTKIVCAMEGDVTLVSSEGGYGKQIRITNGDVLTIYGHCNDIYVQEGQHIAQGQEIGEVGMTGNATGPHLHFEVRYQSRLVDPECILGNL